jgi:hypothetical protein
VLVGEVAQPVAHPGWDVVERLVRRRQQPLPLHPLVGVEHVDVTSAPRIGGAGDLPGQLLLADIRGDADELAGLDVRPEADDQVGEPCGQVGVVAHRAAE